MKKIVDFADKTLPELTKIQYGPLLLKMRWDDYPYELLQYPERALPILMQSGEGVIQTPKGLIAQKAHPLYDPTYAPAKSAHDRASGTFERARADYMAAEKQKLPEAQVEARKNALRLAEAAYFKTGDDLQLVVQKTYNKIKSNQSLVTQYLTKASDHNEPQRAHDEQSGLWRRMWRDLGADAGLFALWADAMGLDPQASTKAMKQMHHTMVGVIGDEVAQINHLMTLTSKLAIQEVYPKYGPMLVGLPDSAPIKTLLPGRQAFAPDKIAHEFEAGLEIGSGKSSVRATGATGFEYAAKDKLRISYWNKILLGMRGREEFMENINTRFPWTKRFLNNRTIDNIPEWLDLHAPLGVWTAKILPVTLAGLLLIIVFAGQQAAGGGEEKKSRSSS